MENYIYVAIAAGILALLSAFVLLNKISKSSEGNDKMKEIAASIREGANAFLKAEYKVLVIFCALIFLLIGFGIGNWVTAICFLVGALFSTLAGYLGMHTATKANVRTAEGARSHGMQKALSIAFSGGAVMGMCVDSIGQWLFSMLETPGCSADLEMLRTPWITLETLECSGDPGMT